MTHLTSGGIRAPVTGHLRSVAALAAPLHRILASRLDRNRLETGIASRQEQLAQLEAQMIADCEAAAAKVASRHARIDDRDSWTIPMWDRYVSAAANLDPKISRRMHRLSHEIQQLQRLLDLLALPDHQPGARIARVTGHVVGDTHAAA
jgi:hypothetical protein